MLRIGLTGGIGAGKSTVADRLAEHGALVIDADKVAREVVEPGTAGFEAVVKEFGSGVVAPDGGLDRAELGRLVFGDERRRAALSAIVHPLVYRRRNELAADAAADAVVVEDIPLLVENGLAAEYPLVIVVHATEDERVQRLAARGLTTDDARARIRAQASDDARRAAADVWLDNSGSVERLRADVDALWTRRLKPFEVNVRASRHAPRSAQPLIVDSDPTWSAQAARLINRLRRVAGKRAWRIDHIGSTSVPGLAAKDVLDVQVVVSDLKTAEVVADDLLEAGLARMPDRWCDTLRDGSECEKAVACNADPGRAVNVHVRPSDSPAWRDALLFRDWLRASPSGVEEYSTLKRRLADGTYAEMNDYAVEKTPWIMAALARADAWAVRTGWSAG